MLSHGERQPGVLAKRCAFADCYALQLCDGMGLRVAYGSETRVSGWLLAALVVKGTPGDWGLGRRGGSSCHPATL
jgi:hypothetical protein